MKIAQPIEMEWKFVRFGLLVTGSGERLFLPSFLRALTKAGNCTFSVIRQIPQRSSIKSGKRKQKMVGTGKTIPDRDAEEIGLPARRFLQKHQDSFVLVVDDLEWGRRHEHRQIFERYRRALDTMLTARMQLRASVHFFVFMIEAYYLANAAAVRSVLDVELEDYDGDVEAIRHPKGNLKQLKPGFDEKADGDAIVRCLDLVHVLRNPATCASLRTLVAWCAKAKGDTFSDEFRLLDGVYSVVTGSQISNVSPSS